MNLEKKAFFEALEADWYSKQLRSDFADWLDQHGDDSAASAMRRTATDEWIKAEKYMRTMADQAGTTTENYGAIYNDPSLRARYNKLSWRKPEDREALEKLHDEAEALQTKHPITYEMLIAIGHEVLDNDDKVFVQVGSENLWDTVCTESSVREWWENWSILTGRKVSEDKMTTAPFTCSC